MTTNEAAAAKIRRASAPRGVKGYDNMLIGVARNPAVWFNHSAHRGGSESV